MTAPAFWRARIALIKPNFVSSWRRMTQARPSCPEVIARRIRVHRAGIALDSEGQTILGHRRHIDAVELDGDHLINAAIEGVSAAGRSSLAHRRNRKFGPARCRRMLELGHILRVRRKFDPVAQPPVCARVALTSQVWPSARIVGPAASTRPDDYSVNFVADET